jgi:hypothetical protein
MKRALDIGNVKFDKEYFAGLPYDPSENNFGIYKGKVVMIDYGSSIEESICPNCKKLVG